MTVRILIADDHTIMRQGLRSLVEEADDMEVIDEASNGRSAVELCQELKPDMVIMDVGMEDLNGIEATRKIKEECPSTKVVGLSVHSDRQYVGGMLEAGASGYLLKDCAFEELENAIRTVLAGRTYLSPSIADIVVRNYVRQVPTKEPTAQAKLTPREREVLQLLTEGKATKQVARELNVSVKTIETHRRNVMHKLDLHSVAELTKYAIREGLTSLNE